MVVLAVQGTVYESGMSCVTPTSEGPLSRSMMRKVPTPARASSVAKAGAGSMRDALSLTDQAIAYAAVAGAHGHAVLAGASTTAL